MHATWLSNAARRLGAAGIGTPALSTTPSPLLAPRASTLQHGLRLLLTGGSALPSSSAAGGPLRHLTTAATRPARPSSCPAPKDRIDMLPPKARPEVKKAKKAKKAKSPKIIDGVELSNLFKDAIKARSTELYNTTGHRPGLAVVVVGTRPDSLSYVKKKTAMAHECGFNSIIRNFPEETSQETILACLQDLDEDDKVDGVLVQLPLPSHISQRKTLAAVSPDKDVDGFHALNMGRLARHGEDMRRNGLDSFEDLRGSLPCTPSGCIALLEHADTPIEGAHAVVIGHSNIVGLPMALMLLHKNATVTVLHAMSDQDKLPGIVKQADIVVAAVGIPEFVKGEWLKPGCTVIDVGINFKDDPTRKSGKRMCGDVDFEAAEKVARRITPVPGGVGPMTVTMLMQNTLDNACKRFGM